MQEWALTLWESKREREKKQKERERKRRDEIEVKKGSEKQKGDSKAGYDPWTGNKLALTTFYCIHFFCTHKKAFLEIKIIHY